MTNLKALKAKYGSTGLRKIRSAINLLIAADKQRGLVTSLVGITASPVNPKQNKIAIDRVYRTHAPDYIMILGAVDVIPHQDLKNPLYSPSPDGDPDKIAFGDLPYACEAAYSQAPQKFFGPTRVVGRLPDITGGKDPRYLVHLLETAAGHKASAPQNYYPYFGITAEIWEKSTGLSLTHIFGSDADLKPVPPNHAEWPAHSIDRMGHFINCHGADTSSEFYGQPASGKHEYPVALSAAYINGKITEGTIGAAECCYGGQLYDPALANGKQGICNTYLANKAYGFFASTTIAYGPSDSNAQADLICQYFLESVLKGGSLGRAALEARQKFVATASPPNPSDIKTLAQFNLYGDPSITPASVPSPMVHVTRIKAARVERSDRRRVLFRRGLFLADTEPQAHPSRKKARKSVQQSLFKTARDLGITPTTLLSFEVKHPSRSTKSMPKMLGSEKPAMFHVVFGRTAGRTPATTERVVQIDALIGKEVDGEVASIAKITSR